MPISLMGRWIGDVRGAIIANIFCQIDVVNDRSWLTFTFSSNGVASKFYGDITDVEVNADFSLPREGAGPQGQQSITIAIEAVDQATVFGRWKFDDGHSGVFNLVRPPAKSEKDDSSDVSAPLRSINRTESFPRTTTYRDDIKELIVTMKSILSSSFEVVVRADVGQKEVSALAPDFWNTAYLPREISQLSLFLTEPNTPIARSINVSFGPTNSYFSVSGPDEVWVAGAFQEIRSVLKSKHTWWQAVYENYALTVNAIVFLIAIIAAPSLQFYPRAVLLLLTTALAVAFRHLYRITTSTRVFLKTDFKQTDLVDYRRIVTSLVGAGLIAVIAWLSHFLASDQVQIFLKAIQESN